MVDVEVAPDTFLSEEDVEANAQLDEQREREDEANHEHFTDAQRGII